MKFDLMVFVDLLDQTLVYQKTELMKMVQYKKWPWLYQLLN
jgi:hypothetical protein